jgi:hypothetical protein
MVRFKSLGFDVIVQYEQAVRDIKLLEWHNRRSHEILMEIIGGKAGFSCKVQRFKIYAPGSMNSDDLGGHTLHLSYRFCL